MRISTPPHAGGHGDLRPTDGRKKACTVEGRSATALGSMRQTRGRTASISAGVVCLLAACSSSGKGRPGSTGGALGTGGQMGTGGSPGTGGDTGTGGTAPSTTVATGGISGTGGARSGGATGTGGTTATGGVTSSGGASDGSVD